MDAPHEQPQTLGAIAGRTLAFIGRHFVPLLRLYAIVSIPLIVLQAIAQQHGAGTFPAVNPTGDLQPAEALAASARMLMSVTPLLVAGAVFVPLGNMVLLITAAALNDGTPADVRDVLERALRRWPAAVGALIVVAAGFILLAVVGLVAIVVCAVVPLLILKSTAPAIGGFVLILLSLLVCACACGFDIMAEMAFCAVALEEPQPVQAVELALRRCLDRGLRRRTIAVALGFGAAELVGAYVSSAAGSLLAAVTHFEIAGVLCAAAGGMLFNAVLLIFMFFYVRDLRVRGAAPGVLEELDVEAEPERTEIAPPSAAAVRNDGLGDAGRASIEQFLERRGALPPEERRAVAARIAAEVRPQLLASFAHLDDEALFEHLTRP